MDAFAGAGERENRMRRENLRKRPQNSGFALPGSFTAETAMLMPVIFAVVFTCVYFCFHLHNRASLTAGCAEQAVSGREQDPPGLPAVSGLQVTHSETETARTCGASAGTLWYTGEKLWDIRVSETYERFRPVAFTRKAHAVVVLYADE